MIMKIMKKVMMMTMILMNKIYKYIYTIIINLIKMSKLDKLINQIRIENIQSVLSPELLEFRKIYKDIYTTTIYPVNNNDNVLKRYKDVLKFFNIIKPNIETKIQVVSSIITKSKIENSKFIKLDNYEYKFYSKKENDLYSWMFFNIFCDKYLKTMNITERNNWLKQIKYDILLDFNKYDLFKKYSYNEDFKKSDLDAIFGMNQQVPLNMIRIYADVCNINCISIDMNGFIKYVNICQKNRATWLIVENEKGDGWYNIIKKKNSNNEYLRYDELSELIINDMKKIEKIDDKLTVDILQNYAKGLGIDPKKDGKVGKKNKLKSELVDEINNKISNLTTI